ncbi:hypothetical protein FKM82_001369 [Ascaphus truei]
MIYIYIYILKTLRATFAKRCYATRHAQDGTMQYVPSTCKVSSDAGPRLQYIFYYTIQVKFNHCDLFYKSHDILGAQIP